MSTSVQQFFLPDLKFGGTGIDGDFHPASNYNFSDAEGSWITKEYSSITIDDGIKVSTDNRIKGLILNCSGDVIINGEIDLDGKAYGSEEPIPLVYDKYFSPLVPTSAWIKYCSSAKGGDGGGAGGSGDLSYTDYYGGNGDKAGGAGGTDSNWTSTTGGSASGWTPGKTNIKGSGGLNLAIGSKGGGLLSNSWWGSLEDPYNNIDSAASKGGGAGYLGTPNAGGNAGSGTGVSATLTTSACSIYGGALLIIIAKGIISLGSTANLHSKGMDSSNISSDTGGNGGGGGGNIILFSQDIQNIDAAAIQSVAGGLGSINSGRGGNGGNGYTGTIINQQVT